ncbi:hypothetical protein SDC9_207277 [bioreactor metagenome]|uniref:Uncharacterized protein n=1 Tax=bioreactor metagenome TaxID=1076179 RepID=A0A645J7Z7_9ZZZZ
MLSHVRLCRVAVISKDQLRHIEAESGKRGRLISGYEIFAGAVHHEDGFAQLRRGGHLQLIGELECFVVFAHRLTRCRQRIHVGKHGVGSDDPCRRFLAMLLSEARIARATYIDNRLVEVVSQPAKSSQIAPHTPAVHGHSACV